jgi:hypothetical protein
MTNYGAEGDPHRKVTGNFALCGPAGTKSDLAVCFELDPGYELGNYTDNAEEIIYVVDRTVEPIIECDHFWLEQTGRI